MRRGVAVFLFASSLWACGEDESATDEQRPGRPGGTSGAAGKAGGTSAGQGGSAGSAGSSGAGSGGGVTTGNGGSVTSGAGGTVTTGTGGSVTAGGAAGKGGSAAGTGGGAAGKGGSAAGTGGSAAGTGGSAAGTGGSAAGTGGSDPGGSGGASLCGNGVRDPGEGCDGTDLFWADCKARGEHNLQPSEGPLSCTSDCKLDTSACTECGDNVKEGPEQCDGTDLSASVTCADVLGGASTGTVTCTKGCVFGGEKCTAPCNPITDVGCSGKRCQRAGSYFPGERLRCVDPSAAGALCSKGLPCGPGLTYRGVGDFVCVPWCTGDADCMGSLCSFAAGIEGFGVCVSYPCP